MKKKVCYVDLDGVVADFDKRLIQLCPEIADLEPYSEERSKLVDKTVEDNPTFFEDLDFVKDAEWAMKWLFSHPQFEVYFLSSPMWWIPHSFTGKRIWVEKMFGELAVKRLILTHRKDLCIGDFLIDDRKKNGAGNFAGQHIHFGQSPFMEWSDVIKYLKMTLFWIEGTI